MSGFFNSLVARSLGAAETLRPRVPSFFEPCHRGAGPLGVRLSDVVAGSRETEEVSDSSHAATQPRQAIAESSAAKDSAGRTGARATVVPPYDPFAGRQFSSPTLRPFARHAQMEAAARALHRNEVSADVARITKGRSMGTSPAESSLEEKGGAIRPTAPVRVHGRAPSRLAPPTLPFSPNATDDSHAASEFVRRGAASRQASAAMPSLGQAMKVPTRLAHSDTSEPAVRVTIGKVEVRAILPDAPVRHAAPAKSRPTLSLDDYLARRNRGQR